ncbi:hypothetical protein BaRGS_00016795, partial [Batillaria attramentaria]
PRAYVSDTSFMKPVLEALVAPAYACQWNQTPDAPPAHHSPLIILDSPLEFVDFQAV